MDAEKLIEMLSKIIGAYVGNSCEIGLCASQEEAEKYFFREAGDIIMELSDEEIEKIMSISNIPHVEIL